MRLFACLLLGMLLPCFGQGGLVFDTTVKEVKAGLDQREITADFSFENKGDKDATITKYEAACSCMSVKVKGGKLHYKPGEKGVVRATFDMGNFSGTVDKAVQVWLKGDGDVSPTVALTVRAHIPVLIEVEPKTLRWDIGGAAESKTLKVTMNHDKPIKVKSVTGSSDNYDIELKVKKEGKEYELLITPKSTEKQGMGLVTIETDCEITRHAVQRAFTVIQSTKAPAAPAIKR